jgi:phage baseplate assembly protein W
MAFNNSTYLGQGVSFPLVVNQFGRVGLTSGKELIEQALITYISLGLGEVFFLRQIGTRIYELLFDPNDSASEESLGTYIKTTIDTWEGRVSFVECKFSYPQDDCILVKVYYKLLNTNEVESFIYPFYKSLKY